MTIPENEITGGGGRDEYPVLDSHRTKLLHRVTRRKEFQLPNRTYSAAPEEMQQIVEGPYKNREKIAAARVLVSMQQSNNQLQTGEARINAILDPVRPAGPPDAPEGFDEATETVFYEVVDPASQKQTLQLMEEMGLLGRYLEQTKAKPSTNGNGHHNGNGSGHHNGNGKH